jgi:hypothetical protein
MLTKPDKITISPQRMLNTMSVVVLHYYNENV